MGKMYRARYINDAYFGALERLKSVAVSVPSVLPAMRMLTY
jgi:hypothetical protein